MRSPALVVNVTRSEHLGSMFHDGFGRGRFLIGDGHPPASSAAAFSAAGFVVEVGEDAWVAAEPRIAGRIRHGIWRGAGCSPATNGRDHDTFEIT